MLVTISPVLMIGAFLLDTQDNHAVSVAVHGPVKPWVYKRLVRNDSDFVGLIAYGLYKKRKTELAESHRNGGVSEEAITVKLREYHDTVVVGENEIDRFRTDAATLLNGLLANISADMRAGHDSALQSAANDKSQALKSSADAHEKAVKVIKVAHDKALKEAKKQAIDDVAKSAKQAKQALGYRDRCLSWLLDGVQSTLAGAVITVFVFGLFAIFTSDNIKIAIATKAVQLLTGSDPGKTTSEKSK